MDCVVYIKLPPYWGDAKGPVSAADGSASNIRVLLKGVPGIPQASRLFYETVCEYLKTLGFIPSNADKCLFLRAAKLDERVALLLWVDDFLFMHEKEETFASFIYSFRQRFVVPDTGTLTTFLGMTFSYANNTITVTQSNSVDVLLERAKMTDCNGSQLPCSSGTVFTKEDCPPVAENTTITEFRSLIALVNFIACWTRPDITFVTNKLCKFMSNPGEAHWKCLKTLIRYLSKTKNQGLLFGGDTASGLHGFTDSSFGDCPDTGRSTLAYVFRYGSCILSWHSKLCSYVNTCTNHAEYSALAAGAKEAEWLITLFEQLEPTVSCAPVVIYVDNSGVISMVLNPVDHKANKHIKISCHYTRELTVDRVITPQRIDTKDNLADVFTKALTGPLFNRFASMLLSPPATTATICLMTAFAKKPRYDSSDDSSLDDMYGGETPARMFYRAVKESDRAARRADRVKDEATVKEADGIDNPTSPAREADGVNAPTYSPVREYDEIKVKKEVPDHSPPTGVRPDFVQSLPPFHSEHLLTPQRVLPDDSSCAIGVPPASIQCIKCESFSTFAHSNLICAVCFSGEFKWLCKCMLNETLDHAAAKAKSQCEAQQARELHLPNQDNHDDASE